MSGTFTLKGASYATGPDNGPSPPMYIGLEVQSWAITDTEYLVATQQASADHTFAFPASQPGRKMFVLYDTADDCPVAVHVPVTGNVRSYLVTPGQPGYGTAFVCRATCTTRRCA